MRTNSPSLRPCLLLLSALLAASAACRHLPGPAPKAAALWLTDPGRATLFQKQAAPLPFTGSASAATLIDVDPAQAYQVMDGFGYALTGGSARLIHQMDAAARAALLRELFSTDGGGIGTSLLRVSIGASDLDEQPFTYDDLPAGQSDPRLAKFSLKPDRAHLLPVLKEILAIDKDLMILGSPWSAPAWMKTNDSLKGGSLKPEFYGAYAQYFVRYLRAMKAEGVEVAAVTVQNEPLNPDNNPSMTMTAKEQTAFVKGHLGPALRAAGLWTRIIIYDHNADRIDYPLEVLADPQARSFVDGSAFHLYGGEIGELSKVHAAHPDKRLYFTEQWVGAPGDLAADLGWHVENLIIGAPRNWCRTVLEWNLAADPKQDPHTVGGCDRCLGAVTINRDQVSRNPAYYIIAHASKFVRPGSVRIASSAPQGLPNAAFRTPQGRLVLVVRNSGKDSRSFGIRCRGRTAAAVLDGGAVGTFVW